MTETRSTFGKRLRSTLGICGVGLISLLSWAAATAAFTDLGCCLPVALFPLVVASFRYPWFGRVLGWSGLLAQVTLLFLTL